MVAHLTKKIDHFIANRKTIIRSILGKRKRNSVNLDFSIENLNSLRVSSRSRS